jgi:CHAD domain-containing protein
MCGPSLNLVAMPYRLSHQVSLGEDLRHVALDELSGALADLSAAAGDGGADSVHGARKHIKRLRALLRLVRDGMDSETVRREGRTLRDAARRLAGLRDEHVLQQTLGTLAPPARGNGEADAPAVELPPDGDAGGMDARSICLAAAASIDAVRNRAAGWRLDGVSDGVISRGLARAWRRARRRFRRVLKRPSAPRMHEWRKRVKDLQYQFELVRGEGDESCRAMSDLAETLGLDHDLAVLRDRLHRRSAAAGPLRNRIRSRRAELRRQAIAAGKRVFAARRLQGVLVTRD